MKPVSIVTGLIRRAKKPIGTVATLKIETPDTANYVIKVIRADTGSEELLIYVRGGETFETKLPFGSYKIWVASGRTWYGEQHYFAKDTVFSEVTRRVSDADQDSLDTFKFYRKGNTIIGYNLILKGRVDGTLNFKSTSEEEFRKSR